MNLKIELEEDVITKEKIKTEVNDKTDDGKVLVLHNDDENTFEHVESCLMQICKHTIEMATNAAITVHTRGRCDVYKGAENKLKKMLWAMQIKGLLVTIED